MDLAVPGDWNVIKKGADNILKYIRSSHNSNSAHVVIDSKFYTANNMDEWNNFGITQTLLD